MDNLPTDIKRHIQSYLDDNSKRILRLASTSWFESVQYSHFNLRYHPQNSRIPRSFFERLTTYRHPISIHLTYNTLFTNELLDQLACTTNLVSLTWPHYLISTDDNPNVDWMKLSTLTNLVHLNYYFDQTNALELLAMLTNITSLEGDHIDEDELEILPYCTKLEKLDVNYLDRALCIGNLTRLTYLRARIDTVYENADETARIDLPTEIEKLVQLKYLSLRESVPQSPWALRIEKLTALESLYVDGIDLEGPCTPTRLTRLCGSAQLAPLCGTFSALKRLKNLGCIVRTEHELNSVAALTGLTDLSLLFEYAPDSVTVLDLPNLESLAIDQMKGAFDAAAIAKLPNLENLRISATTCRREAEIGNLTSLATLSMWCPVDSMEFISSLTNLESVSAHHLKFTRNCLTALTKLKVLKAQSYVDLTSWRCIGDLKNVTYLEISFAAEVKDLQSLTKFDRLTAMDLVQMNQGPLNLDALFHLSSLDNLQLKDLSGGCTSEDWTQISRLTQLTYLSVLGTPLTRAHVASLTKISFLSIQESIGAYDDVQIV
jgi:hypothetical protein